MNTGERVPLSVFVDYVLATGVRRLDVARRYKEGRHRSGVDFYGPLRAAIADMHQRGLGPVEVFGSLAVRCGNRQHECYKPLAAGYRKFLDSAPMTWFQPPHTALPIGDLEVDIRPDSGFNVAGKPFLLAYHFGSAPMTKARAEMTLALLTAALGPTRPGTVFAVLDVGRAKLHTLTTSPDRRLGLLLRGEAAAFGTIYCAI